VDITLEGKPSYPVAIVRLDPGESLIVESSSTMAMDPQLAVETTFNGANGGGFLSWLTAAFVGLVRKFVAGETMFVNVYRATGSAGRVLVAPAMVGDIVEIALDGGRTVTVQAGSFLACTPGVTQKLQWGGLAMLLSGEGAFFLECSGTGRLLINAYGGIREVPVDGTFLVDDGHTVAWEGPLTYKRRNSGGLKATLLSGEGRLLEFRGTGKVWVQSRNLASFIQWITPFFPR
jgi:uncharacterized protein (TIGR00266 family)